MCTWLSIVILVNILAIQYRDILHLAKASSVVVVRFSLKSNMLLIGSVLWRLGLLSYPKWHMKFNIWGIRANGTLHQLHADAWVLPEPGLLYPHSWKVRGKMVHVSSNWHTYLNHQVALGFLQWEVPPNSTRISITHWILGWTGGLLFSFSRSLGYEHTSSF